MEKEKTKLISAIESEDNIDRAGFIKCMAWAGTGVLWMMSGGIMKSFGMSQLIDKNTGGLNPGVRIPAADFSFAVGNSNTPNSWTTLNVAPAVSVRWGAGVAGSDRVELIFPDGTITQEWLQIIGGPRRDET